jgi:hypothetical protein
MSKTMTTRPKHLETVALPRQEKQVRPLKNYWKALLPIVVGAALLFVPIPEGLKANAWYYFALFVAVVIALILAGVQVIDEMDRSSEGAASDVQKTRTDSRRVSGAHRRYGGHGVTGHAEAR